MNRRASIPALVSFFVLLPAAGRPAPGRAATEAAWRIHSGRAANASRQAEATDSRIGEAAVAPVPEIRFDEFFSPVVGDRGLEITGRLQALHGKRVAISGYMVREPRRSPGLFILAPRPARVTDDGFCLIDDIPTSCLHVVTGAGSRAEPFRPGRLHVVGILEVGPAAMPDGRNAYVRLRLDPGAALP